MSIDRTNPSLSDETLAAYALGDLSPEARLAVETALAASPSGRARLGRLRFAADALARTQLHEPPTALVQRALRLASTPAPRPSWFARAADAVASVLFDSLATPSPVGLRSAGLADARHMTFDSEFGEVDVEIRVVGPGAFRVTGQITRDDSGPIELGYRRADSDQAELASVDAAGRFGFQIGRGEWELRIHAAGRVCALPRIQAG